MTMAKAFPEQLVLNQLLYKFPEIVMFHYLMQTTILKTKSKDVIVSKYDIMLSPFELILKREKMYYENRENK